MSSTPLSSLPSIVQYGPSDKMKLYCGMHFLFFSYQKGPHYGNYVSRRTDNAPKQISNGAAIFLQCLAIDCRTSSFPSTIVPRALT